MCHNICSYWFSVILKRYNMLKFSSKRQNNINNGFNDTSKKVTKSPKISGVNLCVIIICITLVITTMFTALLYPVMISMYRRMEVLETEKISMSRRIEVLETEITTLKDIRDLYKPEMDKETTADEHSLTSRVKRMILVESKHIRLSEETKKGQAKDQKTAENKKRKRKRLKNSQQNCLADDKRQIQAIHMKIDASVMPYLDLRTPGRGENIPYWKYADSSINYLQQFGILNVDNGTVQIKENGMYMIYSQMTYYDRSGRWSNAIAINGRSFIKCLVSEWGMEIDPETGLFYNTVHPCYTSGVTYLQNKDVVSIISFYSERIIQPDKDQTFWGIIKLN